MAGTITHQWTGTVLTITSDSGTSSCDLKGAKGDDGPRGAQGAPGSSVAEDSQKLGGVAAAQYALKNNVPAHNLLDNSDFRNPVNQRGQNAYKFDSGYTIDRWKLHWSGDGNITIQDGYITLYRETYNAYLFQFPEKVEKMVGKTYTVAAKVRYNGFIGWIDSTQRTHCDSVHSNDWVVITHTFTVGSATSDLGPAGVEIGTSANLSFDLQWIALYEGSYTADTLPPYTPKGYAAELAECQRYFIRVSNSAAYGIISGTGCVVKVPLPMTMRKDIVPTVTLDGELWAYSHEGYARLNYIGTTYSTNTASLHFTVDTTMSARSCVVPDLSCNISADL